MPDTIACASPVRRYNEPHPFTDCFEPNLVDWNIKVPDDVKRLTLDYVDKTIDKTILKTGDLEAMWAAQKVVVVRGANMPSEPSLRLNQRYDLDALGIPPPPLCDNSDLRLKENRRRFDTQLHLWKPMIWNALFRPSKSVIALATPLLDIMRDFDFTIGIHLRTGGNVGGASDPERTGKLCTHSCLPVGFDWKLWFKECAINTTRSFGQGAKVGWFVTSDNQESTAWLTTLGTANNARVLSLPKNRVVHTDKSSQTVVEWRETVADWYLLSQTSRVIQSASSFSLTAAMWGGVAPTMLGETCGAWNEEDGECAELKRKECMGKDGCEWDDGKCRLEEEEDDNNDDDGSDECDGLKRKECKGTESCAWEDNACLAVRGGWSADFCAAVSALEAPAADLREVNLNPRGSSCRVEESDAEILAMCRRTKVAARTPWPSLDHMPILEAVSEENIGWQAKYKKRVETEGGCEQSKGMWGNSFNSRCTILTMAKIGPYLPGQTVLDWGTGCGHQATFMTKNLALRVVGIDMNAAAVEWAKNHSAGQFVGPVDGTDLTAVPDASFDHFYSFATVYYVQPKQMCNFGKEVARILKPGGTALFGWMNGRYSQPYGSFKESNFDCVKALPDVHVTTPKEGAGGLYTEKADDLISSCNTYAVVMRKLKGDASDAFVVDGGVAPAAPLGS